MLELTILTLPKMIEAAVTESRARRTGTVVMSLSAVAGSSDVAIVAPAPPKHTAEETNASFFPVRHKVRVAMLQTPEGPKLLLSLFFFFFFNLPLGEKNESESI